MDHIHVSCKPHVLDNFDILNLKNYKWEKKGNAVILNNYPFNPQENNDEKFDIICKTLKVQKVLIYEKIRLDDCRSPKASVVFGKDAIITHKENGIKYKFDLEKNMFSSGNITERMRMGTLKCEEEVVVDMFAGVGYFTLPLLIGSKAKVVHAYDWNSSALHYLRENIILNGIDDDRCIVHLVDNRKITEFNIADRVILGLIPTSRFSWPSALKLLKYSTGGTLHIHENCDILAIKNSLFPHLLNYIGIDLKSTINVNKFHTNFHYSSNEGIIRNKEQPVIKGDERILPILLSMLPSPDNADNIVDTTVNFVLNPLAKDMLQTYPGPENLDFLFKLTTSCIFKDQIINKLSPLPSYKEIADYLQTPDIKVPWLKKLCTLYWILSIAATLYKHMIDIQKHLYNLKENTQDRPLVGENIKIVFEKLTKVKSYGPAITHYVLDVNVKWL